MFTRIFLLAAGLLTLTGCDRVNQALGLEDPVKKEARLDGEGKAVGSACRHSGRAIEDCYSIYKWLPKSSIYAGWLEMDGYMRENEIETIPPLLPPPEPPDNGAKKKKKKPAPTPAAELNEEGAVKKEADTGNVAPAAGSGHNSGSSTGSGSTEAARH